MRPRDRVDDALTVLDEDTVRRLRGERVDALNLIGDFRQRGLESTKTFADAVAKVSEIDAALAGGQASVVDEVAVRCREHARRIDAAANALADVLAEALRYARSVQTNDVAAREMLAGLEIVELGDPELPTSPLALWTAQAIKLGLLRWGGGKG